MTSAIIGLKTILENLIILIFGYVMPLVETHQCIQKNAITSDLLIMWFAVLFIELIFIPVGSSQLGGTSFGV
jgi:hypothetical protein